MKKICLNLSVLITLLFITSCNDYLDINQNPNSVLYNDLYPNELISAAQTGCYRTQSMTMNQYGNILTNAWSGNANLYGAGVFGTSEYTLNYTSTFLNNVWDNQYININNLQQIINTTHNADHKWDNYVAVAKILKAHYMQYVFDLYGDAPYSEAFKGSANVTPKYDNDEDAYKALIAELEEAWTMLDAPNANAISIPSTEDVMLAGNINKWKKFAATVELRMLLRMSNKTGALASYRDSHLNGFLSGSTISFVDAPVSINPGYNSTTTAGMNPYYYNFIASTPSKLGPSGHAYKCLFNDWTGSSSTEVISGTGVYYPNVADPRRTRLFKPGSGSNIFALTQGVVGGCDVYSTANSSATSKPFGNLGLGNANPYNAISGTGTVFAAANGYVMTLAESEFLQAEAHLRGYLGGTYTTAENHYKAGILDSFKFLMGNTVSQTTVVTPYINSISAKPYFGMNSANSPSQNLCAIMYQKWVGLMGIHGMESYIEYTRTGFPYTPLSLSTTRTSKPTRLIYPASEYSNNTANAINLTSDDVFGVNAYTPFWKQ